MYSQLGAYTDCYAIDVGKSITHRQYVEAFYTTPLFKFERLLLTWLVSKPSTDAQARELASAERSTFAAWSVEARSEDQLLLSDFKGRTRSWLMVEPVQDEKSTTTRLYFGSAFVPGSKASDHRRKGFAFHALLGFHKLYSKLLLKASASRLMRIIDAERSA
jgi:hypothetical protein